MFCGERVVWHRPTSLEELLVLKSKYPQAKLVNGNTEVGMYECCIMKLDSRKLHLGIHFKMNVLKLTGFIKTLPI